MSGSRLGKGVIIVVLLLLAVWTARELKEKFLQTPHAPVALPSAPAVQTQLPVTPPPIAPPKIPTPVPVKPTPVHPPAVKPVVKKPAVKTKPLTPPSVPVTPSVPVVVTPPEPPPPQEWKGTDTSVTHAGQVVVHTDRQWTHFWSEHHPHEVSPDVDFSRNMVIGVFAGSRPADQFSISIVSVQPQNGALVVQYQEHSPPVGTLAVNVSAYPYDIKVLPQSPLPVKFVPLAPAQ